MLAQRAVKLKFDGQPHQVDLNVYTQVLLDFATVVKASTKITDPNAQVGITVAAPERGSLIANLNLAVSQAPGMIQWAGDHLDELADIVVVVGELYRFHRFASGKKIDQPAEIAGNDNVVVKDNQGSSITITQNVYNTYVNQPNVPAALAHTFGTLDEDPAITGFAISDPSQEEPVFRADRSEFSGMAETPDIAVAETPGVEKVIEEASLYVVKAVLERNYTRKWEFIWSGNKISANIRDEKFFDRLEAHQYAFGQGDVLKVRLEITRELDPALGTFVNRGYSIIEVLEFIERGKDVRMF